VVRCNAWTQTSGPLAPGSIVSFFGEWLASKGRRVTANLLCLQKKLIFKIIKIKL